VREAFLFERAEAKAKPSDADKRKIKQGLVRMKNKKEVSA
jgi:hypothetical protein